MMENNAKKYGVEGFIKSTGIIIFIVVFAIIIALSVFWKYLDCYQMADPTIPVDAFIGFVKTGDYKSAKLLADSDSKVFENDEQLDIFISENFSEGFELLTIHETEISKNSYSYEFYNGNRKVLTLSVGESEESVGFGIKKFKINSISVEQIEKINLIAPKGSVVYVNGIVIDEALATEKSVSNNYTTVPEELLPVMMNYTIEGYITYPEIAVTYNLKITGPNAETITQEKICERTEYEDDFNLTYVVAMSESLLSDACTKAVEACKNYEAFVSRGLNVNYLLRHVYTESSFYTEMKEYDNTDQEVQYGMTFSEDKIKFVNMFDETHVSVSLTMSKTMKISGETLIEKNDYLAYLILVDGKWMITEIVSN